MGKADAFLRRVVQEADTTLLPGQCLVELAGQQRVLIENHQGVRGYSRECILVKVNFGFVRVWGSCLELAKMTREQLVILGSIEGVRLLRRDGHG